MAQRAKVLRRLNLLEAQGDYHWSGKGGVQASREAKHSAQMYARLFQNVSTPA
jgi:hypothetical protein